MRRIAALLAVLLLLSACSGSPEPPVFPDISPGQDASMSPPPSQPQASPSLAPLVDVSGSPNVQDDPLTAAFKNGELVIGADGAALNYQPWLEFASALDSGHDASLTVFVRGENGDAPESRFFAEYNGSALWRELSGANGGESLEGNALSVTFDAPSGRHALLLDGKETLTFTYYPLSSEEAAVFWGYTALKEIAPFYTWNEALSDGCLVVNETAENVGMMTAFAETFGFDEGSFMRVYETVGDGAELTDIAYVGKRVCVTRDATRAGGGISAEVFDDCELTLADTDGGKELRLSDNQTGLEHALLSVKG